MGSALYDRMKRIDEKADSGDYFKLHAALAGVLIAGLDYYDQGEGGNPLHALEAMRERAEKAMEATGVK